MSHWRLLVRFRRDKAGGGSGTPNSASDVGVSGRDVERGSGERSDPDVVTTTDALKVILICVYCVLFYDTTLVTRYNPFLLVI